MLPKRYDDPRNAITLTETIGTASPEQTHYQFGRHNELVEVRYPTYKVEYGYEGPMRARSFERSTDIATGALNYERTYCYGDLGRLTTMNDSRGKVVNYSYDQNGNQITKSVAENNTTKLTRFTYDIRDRMRKVEEEINGGNPTTVGEYDYDESGRRIEQTTAEGILRTSYDGDEVLNEWEANTSQTARSSYLHGNGMLLARRDQRPNLTQTYRMTWNHLGSTSETVDEAGLVAAQYRYDAWGQFKTLPTATELETSGGRTLTGQKFDKETGLFAMGNGTRFYDADTGMFNQKDPMYGEADDPQSMSPYAYARNNPVLFTDPTGLYAYYSNTDPSVIERVRMGSSQIQEGSGGHNYALSFTRKDGTLDFTELGQFLIGLPVGQGYVIIEKGERRKDLENFFRRMGVDFNSLKIYDGNKRSLIEGIPESPLPEPSSIAKDTAIKDSMGGSVGDKDGIHGGGDIDPSDYGAKSVGKGGFFDGVPVDESLYWSQGYISQSTEFVFKRGFEQGRSEEETWGHVLVGTVLLLPAGEEEFVRGVMNLPFFLHAAKNAAFIWAEGKGSSSKAKGTFLHSAGNAGMTALSAGQGGSPAMVAGVHKATNTAVRDGIVYEIKINGKTFKFGIADFQRVTKEANSYIHPNGTTTILPAGTPTRLNNQLRRAIENFDDVEYRIVSTHQSITTQDFKFLEDSEVLNYHARRGAVPSGNKDHAKKLGLDKENLFNGLDDLMKLKAPLSSRKTPK